MKTIALANASKYYVHLIIDHDEWKRFAEYQKIKLRQIETIRKKHALGKIVKKNPQRSDGNDGLPIGLSNSPQIKITL